MISSIILTSEDNRIHCPSCSNDRKKSNKTMSLKRDGDVVIYYCHHCGIKGAVRRDQTENHISLGVHSSWREPKSFRPATDAPFTRQWEPPVKQETKPAAPAEIGHIEKDQAAIDSWLTGRGIDPALVADYPLCTGVRYGKECIGFVYGPSSQPEAIKWRAIHTKSFTQTGAARSFWGIDQLDPEQDLIICEGEADVLALACAGIRAVSVPNGAPSKVSAGTVDPSEDGKYSYVWAARHIIEKSSRVVFFPDADAPGEALVEELARRIGRAKCWKVSLPEKDANETLSKHGPAALQEALRAAQPLPLEGIYTADDFAQQIDTLYSEGVVRGASTGMESVDPYYTIMPGQLSVVTGLPGSGKSEFIDQIMVNIAMQKGWRFAIASFENPIAMHVAKLSEKVIGKPFFGDERMTEQEKDYATSFISEHFVFLQSRDGTPSTVQSIIDRTKQAIMRLGVRGLVIDPYNYLELTGDSEHQAINRMLSDIILFAKSHEIHVWFVAHPSKQLPDSGPPVGQHISGSAAWFAKCDMGITIHRSKGSMDNELHVWKSRFKWVGQIGSTVLKYERQTGRFYDSKAPIISERSGEWDEWDF